MLDGEIAGNQFLFNSVAVMVGAIIPIISTLVR